MKKGDLQKMLRDYGEAYLAYNALGANPPDESLRDKHALGRIQEYDKMKEIERKLWNDEIELGRLRQENTEMWHQLHPEVMGR